MENDLAPNNPNQVQTPPDTERVKKKSSAGIRGKLTTLLILVSAPILALSLTAFVFQSYVVDGESMESTLHNSDRLIVWKAPRTMARITGNDYMPNRGDIIIFVAHNLEGIGDTSSNDKQLIKRVIGLPGDRVVVKDDKITIYNSANPRGFDPDASNSWGKVIKTTSGDIDTVIKNDQVFVCGDNRGNSRDSRELGPISSNDIVGKMVVRVFPLNSSSLF